MCKTELLRILRLNSRTAVYYLYTHNLFFSPSLYTEFRIGVTKTEALADVNQFLDLLTKMTTTSGGTVTLGEAKQVDMAMTGGCAQQ